MKKSELVKRIARERRISQATAADQIDSAVHEILQNLKSGEEASLPGLGTLLPGPELCFRVEKKTRKGAKDRSG